MIDGPYVAALPAAREPNQALLIAWRDRDGTTSIASPFELPWLGAPLDKA